MMAFNTELRNSVEGTIGCILLPSVIFVSIALGAAHLPWWTASVGVVPAMLLFDYDDPPDQYPAFVSNTFMITCAAIMGAIPWAVGWLVASLV